MQERVPVPHPNVHRLADALAREDVAKPFGLAEGQRVQRRGVADQLVVVRDLGDDVARKCVRNPAGAFA
jgi:hypothetical protein